MAKGKKGHRPTRGKGRRLRVVRLALLGAVFPAVLAGAVAVHLYVQVTSRFEGRLWAYPSRVYSAVLEVRPGITLDQEALLRRLWRSGYAAAPGTVGRPGQYRRQGPELVVFLRSFDGPEGRRPARAVHLFFSGDSVVSLRDARGRSLSRVEVEPELLATLYGPRQEERIVLPLQQIPALLVRAVLAAEDARFPVHHGVDLRAMVRAALANLRSKRIVQGGSTITQQTVKNLFLGQERTWARKIREIPMALLLDALYPKEKILEVYLNEVYLGQRGPVAVCGVQAAARYYFGRDLRDLDLGEMALLAGLVRNPGGYNPFTHPERAVKRRDRVLDRMVELGWMDKARAGRAAREPLRLGSGEGGFSGASYLVDFVRGRLVRSYTHQILQEEGLRIHTTVDTILQEKAEAALRDGLDRLERRRPRLRRKKGQDGLQGCVVITRPRTGDVLAMVGGRDYRSSQFNRAVQARRQPGSCFKPFVYLAGFEEAIHGDGRQGLTPATLLQDEPLKVRSGGKLWRPSNYDGRFRGAVTVRDALEQSLNVPTVRAALRVGLARVVQTAHACGLPKSLRPLPSLALGAQEVTPLELAAGYGTLASGGRRAVPRIIRTVTDRRGRRLERIRGRSEQVVDARSAYLVNDILRGVLLRGTARSAGELGFHGDIAGKTGTTDQNRDAWFVGYTSQVLALVWVGYDDNHRTGLTGASGALPIWVDLVRRTGVIRRERGFREPPGIVHRTVDPTTGALAVAGCPVRRDEIFAAGTEPTEECSEHRRGIFRRFRDFFRRRGGRR